MERKNVPSAATARQEAEGAINFVIIFRNELLMRALFELASGLLYCKTTN